MMLIPYHLAQKNPEMVRDLEILRTYARKDMDIEGQIVDRVVIQNVVWNDGGVNEQHPYSQILDKLCVLADGWDMEDGWDRDDDWYSKAILIHPGTFDHVKNYLEARQMTSYEGHPLEIVEGFLILETRNGVFHGYR